LLANGVNGLTTLKNDGKLGFKAHRDGDGSNLMKPGNQDLFRDAGGQPRRLRGVAIASGSTRLAEMAARMGFDTAWIEMEHGHVDFSQVELLCMAVEAGGGIPTVRVPDGQRHHVLRALEVGARIVVVPMINSAAEARRIVDHGKFPPLGSRGFNLRSRGLGYGLKGREVSFAAANAQTHLFAQVETPRAVECVDEICEVEGLSGVLIGPGDLSSSMGRPGDFEAPEVIDAVSSTIRLARSAGKHAGIFAGPGPLLDAATAAGCDLMFVSSDLTGLVNSWSELLAVTKTS
jgi:4-hydroxy-2-oxoheptanedioate aldolase